ncbi:MAG: J domain-containing protein [Deltaproteobacteria bacterium]|nr:J domain-containing protein [Deltaproteobacteria bacterium]
MPTRDYYEVLGVKRDASPDDLKKAYRALAMQYHPDRRPGDEEAARRFREITEAWQVLSDPEQRARYDSLGPLFRADGKPPTPEDLNAYVAGTFANLFGRKKREKGEDLKYTLSLQLEEVATGCVREVSLRRRTRCGACEGTGAEPKTGRKPCAPCKGSGRSPTRVLLRTDCPHCDGRGWVKIADCRSCDGRGALDLSELLKIRVPAGVANGQKLKIKGKGDEPKDGGAPGDLLVLLSVAEHPLFRRRGLDLLCEAPLLFTEAALGAELQVPTLTGVTTIRIPSGTPSGRIFKLSGRGLPEAGGKAVGDLQVKVVVEVPPALEPEARAALSRLSGVFTARQHPARQQWDEALAARRSPGDRP